MRTISLEIKNHDAGGFTGYGSVFCLIDRHRDIMVPGAFKSCIDDFLAEGFIGGVGHNHSAPIGRPVKAYEDQRGLVIEAKYSDVESARDARTLIADGVVRKLSVGFEPGEVTSLSRSEVEKLWADSNYSPRREDVRRLKSHASVRAILTVRKLFEVSPVTIPANDDCAITAFKSAPRSVVTWLGRIENTFHTMATDGNLKLADLIISQLEQALADMRAQRDAVYKTTDEYQAICKRSADAELLKIQIQKLRQEVR